MGWRAAARGRRRGGESIPALRPFRVRLVARLTAVALAAALAAASAALAGWLLRAVLPIAIVGFLCALGAALASPRLVAPALLALGTACAIVEAAGRASLGWLLLFSCSLVSTAELLLWQEDVRQATEVDRSLVRSRTASLAAIVVGAAVVAAISALAAGIRFSGVFEAALVGTMAMLLLLLLGEILLRPSRVRDRLSA